MAVEPYTTEAVNATFGGKLPWEGSGPSVADVNSLCRRYHAASSDVARCDEEVKLLIIEARCALIYYERCIQVASGASRMLRQEATEVVAELTPSLARTRVVSRAHAYHLDMVCIPRLVGLQRLARQLWANGRPLSGRRRRAIPGITGILASLGYVVPEAVAPTAEQDGMDDGMDDEDRIATEVDADDVFL